MSFSQNLTSSYDDLLVTWSSNLVPKLVARCLKLTPADFKLTFPYGTKKSSNGVDFSQDQLPISRKSELTMQRVVAHLTVVD